MGSKAIRLLNGGTLGDTYICVCHWINKRQPIEVLHYTRHSYWHKEIRDIYSLLPNVRNVTFTEKRPGEKWSSPYSKVNRMIGELEPFPKFSFPESKFDPGEPYIALCPKSGKPSENRRMRREEVDRIVRKAPMPVVVIGPGETSLLEAMGLVSRARKFFGSQGLMSFVALSHKVQSTVYVPNEREYLAFRGRLARPWIKFLDEVKMK